MLRFTLIPLILLFGGIFCSIIAFVIIRKIKKGVKYTYEKGAEISNQYQEKWREKEQRSKLPEIVQTGFDNYYSIETSIKKLPENWQLLLKPLEKKSHSLLNEISHHLINDDTFERSKLSSLRSFFNHSLDALKQLCNKLLSDHPSLSEDEINKAKANITLIYADLIHHEELLKKKRKFDFDVLMDVIKARIK